MNTAATIANPGDPNSIRDLVGTLVAEKCRAVDVSFNEVTNQTNLYNEGIVDSFDVVEMLTVIEEKTGIPAYMSDDDGVGFVVSIDWFVERFVSKNA